MFVATFTGNLGADADFAYSKTGLPWLRLSIAISNGKDKEPLWVKAAVFGAAAERMTQNYEMRKGQKVVVSCTYPPEVKQFERKDGTVGTSLEFVADYVEFPYADRAMGMTDREV